MRSDFSIWRLVTNVGPFLGPGASLGFHTCEMRRQMFPEMASIAAPLWLEDGEIGISGLVWAGCLFFVSRCTPLAALCGPLRTFWLLPHGLDLHNLCSSQSPVVTVKISSSSASPCPSTR